MTPEPILLSYASLLKENIYLFDTSNVLEMIREWFILITSILIVALFSLSIRRLQRAQRTFDFDQLIIAVEIGKVRNKRLISLTDYLSFFRLLYSP